MSNYSPRDLEFWFEAIEGLVESGSGWRGLCPAHDDRQQSLFLSENEDGNALVYCFAGCSYQEILSAAQERSQGGFRNVKLTFSTPRDRQPSLTFGISSEDSAAWWEERTGVPREFWESLGVKFSSEGVEFLWESIPTRKIRPVGEKKFFWVPSDDCSPPLWPEFKAGAEEIWITEGESDAGILRYVGLPAYAFTKGAGSVRKIRTVWNALRSLGVSVVLVGDLDEPGERFVSTASAQALSAVEGVSILMMDQLVNPLLGQKDIRDAWLACRDRERFRELLLENVKRLQSPKGATKVEASKLLTSEIDSTASGGWLVKDVLLEKSTAMIIGHPKIGKTWYTLDLLTSISTGTKFLNTFPVTKTGTVVYFTAEDTFRSLRARLSMIYSQKGFGGRLEADGGTLRVSFPKQTPHEVFIVLDRQFSIESFSHGDSLAWLDSISESGKIAAIAFDPILRMMSGDVYKVSDVSTSVFRPAGILQERYDASIILVHHKPKGEAGGTRSYFGSIGFHAFADQLVFLTPFEIDQMTWLQSIIESKSAPETTWYCRFDISDVYRPVVEQKIPLGTVGGGANLRIETDFSDRLALVEGIVSQQPDGVSITTLSTQANLPPRTLLEVVEALVESGRIREDEQREYWYLPAEGKARG